MKIKVTVVSCNAPTVRVIAGNENGISTTSVEAGKSVEVEGLHVKIEAGPDNRALTAEEAEVAAEEKKARDAADAKAKK